VGATLTENWSDGLGGHRVTQGRLGNNLRDLGQNDPGHLVGGPRLAGEADIDSQRLGSLRGLVENIAKPGLPFLLTTLTHPLIGHRPSPHPPLGERHSQEHRSEEVLPHFYVPRRNV